MTAAHVECILVAEFDIDKGASLAYQYPKPTGTDEHVLAELMLPDGAHLREEDWTIFFLNQAVPTSDAPLTPAGEKAPILYVLNLVRTKHDASARRGAMVKALAICTRHQYLHIYKPILLLALDAYFTNPSEQILINLHVAVNAMDLSLLPEFSPLERRILRASPSGGMFEERFQELERVAASRTSEDEASRGNYINLNARNTSANPADTPKPLKIIRNKDRHFFETVVLYANIRIPIRIPLTLGSEEVGDFSLIKLFTTFTPPNQKPFPPPHPPELMSDGPYTHPIILLINALLTQRRVLFLGAGRPSGEVAQYVLAACALGSGGILRGFTERAFPYTNLTNIDQLLEFPGFIAGVTNSIFENHPSWWDVLCDINTGKITISKDIEPCPTLADPSAAVGLASMSINDSSSMPIPAGAGAFASASNPILSPSASANPTPFSRSPNALTPTTPTTKQLNEEYRRDRQVESTDSEFISDLLRIIQSHYGENAMRARAQEYISRLIQVAAIYEEVTYDSTEVGLGTRNTIGGGGLLGSGAVFVDDAAKARELRGNRCRIEAWRDTLSYRYRQEDFRTYLRVRTIDRLDVERQVHKLRILRGLRTDEVEAMYAAFLQYVQTDEQMMEFLSFLPQQRGGLTPLASGLFHPSRAVRDFTIEFLERINAHITGKRFVAGLDRFHRLAFDRLSHSY